MALFIQESAEGTGQSNSDGTTPNLWLILGLGCVLVIAAYFWGKRSGAKQSIAANTAPKFANASCLLIQPASEERREGIDESVQHLEQAVDHCANHPEIEQLMISPSYLKILLNRQAKDLEHLLLQERINILGILVAGIAHEVANPIGYVTVSTENMQADMSKFRQFLFGVMGEDADDEIIEDFKAKLRPLDGHMDIILDGCDRIRQLTRVLQNFARTQIKRKPVKIAELAENVIGMTLPRFKRQVEFELIGDRNTVIYCRANQLSQVLLSLVINSCQAIVRRHSQNGSSYVGTIKISLGERGGFTEIHVSDDGVGIKGPDQELVFQPGFQGYEGKGNGMGLTLARRVVEEHGGHISLTSTEGQGTVVSMAFPRGNDGTDSLSDGK